MGGIDTEDELGIAAESPGGAGQRFEGLRHVGGDVHEEAGIGEGSHHLGDGVDGIAGDDSVGPTAAGLHAEEAHLVFAGFGGGLEAGVGGLEVERRSGELAGEGGGIDAMGQLSGDVGDECEGCREAGRRAGGIEVVEEIDGQTRQAELIEGGCGVVGACGGSEEADRVDERGEDAVGGKAPMDPIGCGSLGGGQVRGSAGRVQGAGAVQDGGDEGWGRALSAGLLLAGAGDGWREVGLDHPDIAIRLGTGDEAPDGGGKDTRCDAMMPVLVGVDGGTVLDALTEGRREGEFRRGF